MIPLQSDSMRHNFLDRYGHVDSPLHRMRLGDAVAVSVFGLGTAIVKFLWKA
jgi:hypothetical protein